MPKRFAIEDRAESPINSGVMRYEVSPTRDIERVIDLFSVTCFSRSRPYSTFATDPAPGHDNTGHYRLSDEANLH